MTISYPTLKEINNQGDVIKDQLALLRILNSSDLTFLYMLYKKGTIDDIISVAESLFNQGDHGLSAYEIEEYLEYISDLKQYEG